MISEIKNLKIDKLSNSRHRILNKSTSSKVFQPDNLKPAVFLDRDGVIIKDCHYISNPEQVEVLQGAIELMLFAKKIGFIIIVVTNQSGISKGFLNWGDYEKVTLKMLSNIGEPILIDGIYANSNPPHEIENHKCWRKPNPNMLFAAKEDFNLDLDKSIIIGDRLSDILAGKKAGLKKLVHVLTGHGIKEREIIKKELDAFHNEVDLFYIRNLLEFPFNQLKIN